MENNGWILVSDRLPEENKEVLIYTGGGYYDIDTFCNGDWKKIDNKNYVIAWKPIEKFNSKMVEKTITIKTTNYYHQKVIVSECLNNNEIIDLWRQGEIAEMSEPKLYTKKTEEVFIEE
jgi:hypothetical protein